MLKKVLLISLGLIILGVSLFFLFFVEGQNGKDVKSFQDCVDAGYPVMESYPRQCSVPNGESFVEEVDGFEEGEYYGSSTNYSCEEHTDCVVAGCNSEICTGVDEGGMSSICVYPEIPLPQDLGYSCGCFKEKCQWGKD